jgi:hypothetical protein
LVAVVVVPGLSGFLDLGRLGAQIVVILLLELGDGQVLRIVLIGRSFRRPPSLVPAADSEGG